MLFVLARRPLTYARRLSLLFACCLLELGVLLAGYDLQ